MAVFVKMPKLGLTMAEGTILKWLKKEGDEISKGEPIVEVESDKSNIEFESPGSGILKKILVNEGEVVPILTEIAIIADENEEIPDTDYKSGIKEKEVKEDNVQITNKSQNADAKENDNQSKNTDRIFISPAARRIAKENNVDISLIKTNKVRIEKADVLEFINKNKVKTTPVAAKIAEEKGIDLKDISKSKDGRIYSYDLVNEESLEVKDIIKVTGMRKAIATKMRESLDKAAHVSITTEVDMSRVIDLRSRLIDKIKNKYDVKLSINDIIMKVIASAVKEHPKVNATFNETEIIIKDDINVGMAVGLDEGLIVPVIKNADKKSLGLISKESKELVKKAKDSILAPDEYSGGTITVSNLGMYDITHFNSIINYPEIAIISAAKIVERPVVVEGEILIKPIMNLTLTYDHRPIDGTTATAFLMTLKQMLEEPYEIMI